MFDVDRARHWSGIHLLVVCCFQGVQYPGRQLGVCRLGNAHHHLGSVVAMFARVEKRVGIFKRNRDLYRAQHQTGTWTWTLYRSLLSKKKKKNTTQDVLHAIPSPKTRPNILRFILLITRLAK